MQYLSLRQKNLLRYKMLQCTHYFATLDNINGPSLIRFVKTTRRTQIQRLNATKQRKLITKKMAMVELRFVIEMIQGRFS